MLFVYFVVSLPTERVPVSSGHSRFNSFRGLLSSRCRLGMAESSFPRKLRLVVGQCSGELGDMLRPKLVLDDSEPGLTLCNP